MPGIVTRTFLDDHQHSITPCKAQQIFRSTLRRIPPTRCVQPFQKSQRELTVLAMFCAALIFRSFKYPGFIVSDCPTYDESRIVSLSQKCPQTPWKTNHICHQITKVSSSLRTVDHGARMRSPQSLSLCRLLKFKAKRSLPALLPRRQPDATLRSPLQSISNATDINQDYKRWVEKKLW